MPNTKPIIRAMEWGIVLEKLPDSISRHLPNGDPRDNMQEIESTINQMTLLGPKGYRIKQKHLNGIISYHEFERQLDRIGNQIDKAELKRLESNLETIKREVTEDSWRRFIPFLNSSVRVSNIDVAIKNLHTIDLYETQANKVEKQTQEATVN